MNIYKTPDLGLSAFLRCHGCRLRETTRQGSQVFFLFEYSGDINALVGEFFNDGSVPVQGFIQNLNMLRSLVKNGPEKKG